MSKLKFIFSLFQVHNRNFCFYRKCEPGHSLASAFQDLCAFSEANLNGFPSQNLNFKDMDVVNKVCEFDKLENSMENFTCLKCPKFSEHVSHFLLNILL